ncbi:unnamed protein product [Durusdinium trenchii]|uniref:C3H1-type domain-containing protein n=1 Tax=Durusdinium trenchii TaxID=1381693 RepID=A0ABP0QVW2_9DINO
MQEFKWNSCIRLLEAFRRWGIVDPNLTEMVLARLQDILPDATTRDLTMLLEYLCQMGLACLELLQPLCQMAFSSLWLFTPQQLVSIAHSLETWSFMATLRLRGTFIDVEEGYDVDSGRSRSFSPARARTEADVKESEYLATLLGRSWAEEFRFAPFPESETDVNEAAEAEPDKKQDEEAALSPGSIGHPVLCCRPCVRFFKGECNLGANCAYCHLQHQHLKLALDKNQRQYLRMIDLGELVALLLPHIHMAISAVPDLSAELADPLVKTLQSKMVDPFPPMCKDRWKAQEFEKFLGLARLRFLSPKDLEELLEALLPHVGRLSDPEVSRLLFALALSNPDWQGKWQTVKQVLAAQYVAGSTRNLRADVSVAWAFAVLQLPQYMPDVLRLLDTHATSAVDVPRSVLVMLHEVCSYVACHGLHSELAVQWRSAAEEANKEEVERWARSGSPLRAQVARW